MAKKRMVSSYGVVRRDENVFIVKTVATHTTTAVVEYKAVLKDGKITCDCARFRYEHDCPHIVEVMKELK